MSIFAFFQNRLGRTDGVSLEVDKWRNILRDRLGHEVLYCSGNDDVVGNIVIPELYAHHPTTWRILRNGTVSFTDYSCEADFEAEIYAHADVIENRLLDLIERRRPDCLVPNNLCSGGYQPAAGIAFHRVLRKTGLPAIVHSHDFYFEESGEVRATCQTVSSIYERYFPPRLPGVEHVVINRIAQTELRRRKGIEATVVPNVFDFDQKPWMRDEYNADLRASFDIGPDDLVVIQATRILDRKGIELAVDVVAALSSPARRRSLRGVRTAGGGVFGSTSRIVLFCAGIVESIGISGTYWDAVKARAREAGVEIIHAGDRVRHSRGFDVAGRKIWSLWDSYTMADVASYPSLWEGWGNQFIEAVFAKLPIFVFEYPVWKSDLGREGFDVVSLGGELLDPDDSGLAMLPPVAIENAADSLCVILADPRRRNEAAGRNFAIGRDRFSFDALEIAIRGLLSRITT